LGTPSFAVPVLQALAAHHEVMLVVSQPDRPRGRGKQLMPTPVKAAAGELGLPVFQPTRIRDEEAMAVLRGAGAQVMITAAYGQILSQEVLDIAPLGVMNVHASLLPAYRGAAPVPWAVIHGERETGVTIMQTARGVDTGDILAQAACEIGDDDTAGSLLERLADMAAGPLLAVLEQAQRGELRPAPQDESLASHAPMLSKQDGWLDFSQSARQVRRRFMGLTPEPGVRLGIGGVILRVAACRVLAGESIPGRLAVVEGALCVGCADGWLALDEVVPAGKGAMKGTDYARGLRQTPEWADGYGDETRSDI